MAAKRDRPDDGPRANPALPPSESGPAPKKARHGFRVGPANLPDGPWRRKLARTKKELIHSAKVKKAYAKLKAQEAAAAAPTTAAPATSPGDDDGTAAAAAGSQIHPERLAMLDGHSAPVTTASAPAASEGDGTQQGQTRRESEAHSHGAEGQRGGPRGSRGRKKADYFRKDLAVAEKRRRQAEERQAERQRRQDEREQKVAARRRNEKAMAKARVRGPDGQRKLGRESSVLLEKVKRMVGR